MNTMKLVSGVLILALAGCNSPVLENREDWLKGDNRPKQVVPDICEDPCLFEPGSAECIVLCEMNPDDPSCEGAIDCIETPLEPACLDFCKSFPFHVMCNPDIDFCKDYPDSPECKAHCIMIPDDPDCSGVVDCADTPEDPACLLYCLMNSCDQDCKWSGVVGVGNIGDAFKQIKGLSQVDILWVIDSSGSMKDEQQALATNFGSFINTFLTKDIDFKMGITTTDTDNDKGEFRGSTPVLTSEMDQNFVSKTFSKNIVVGTDGSGNERGLKASKMALMKNTEGSSANFGFLREDAFLAVIIVSDENDISPYSTKSYIDSIMSVKEKDSDVAIYGIVDTITESYPDPFDEPIDLNIYGQSYSNPGGLRYMTAATVSGGFSVDIHQEFSDSLLKIGTGIVELMSRFELDHEPLISSIRLKIDGVDVPHNSTNGWTYDPETNSILFRGDFLPPVNAVVEVAYRHLVME